MNPLWWIPIGLVAWCALGVAVALVLGPVLARNSRGPGQPCSGDEEAL